MAKRLNIPRDLIRRLTAVAECRHLHDGALLRRYVNRQDGAAFAELVERHGGMVYSVCSRILRSKQDAEDACQATFLILVRKAGGIRRKTSLACWLHGVARRVSLTALRGNLNRRNHEQTYAMASTPATDTDSAWSQVQSGLDRELESLPERYRSPIVLCYLEGKTRDEAAQILRISAGKLHGLLERGRGLLQGRLEKQVVGFGAAMLGTILTESSCHALPPELANQTVTLALASHLPASEAVTTLSNEVLKVMFHTKLKAAATSLVIAAVLIGGGIALAGIANGGDETPPPAAPVVVAASSGPKSSDAPLFRGILKGHKGAIASVAVSSDAKRIVSGSYDGTVRVWDAVTGKEQMKIDAFESCVGSATISPNGKFIAATCAGSPVPGNDLDKIKIWDASTGEKKMTLKGHKTMGTIVSFSPDGKRLASAGIAEVKFWDIATGKETGSLKGHEGWINSLVYSGDGKLLATKCNDGIIKIWDVASGKEVGSHRSENSFGHMAFSRDGKTIATVDGDNTVVVYEVVDNSFREQTRIIAGKKGERVLAVALSPDGKSVVAGGESESICQWDATTGKPRKTFQGHKESVMSLSFSPDGKTLISGGNDATVQMWNAEKD